MVRASARVADGFVQGLLLKDVSELEDEIYGGKGMQLKRTEGDEELVVVAVVQRFCDISKNWEFGKNLVDFWCCDNLGIERKISR